MDLGLRGKTAIVAAASQGLGKAVAMALAQEGANLVIFSRRRQAIEAAAHDIRTGLPEAQVVALAADVTDPAYADQVLAAAERFGGADVLYNNAGGPKPGMFETLTDADWERAFQLNLMSAVRLTRACLPHMRSRHWGRVITGTSTSVKQPIETLMLSNAIRSATTAWSKTLADQVAPDGITVNTLAPGRILTDRIREIDEDRSRRTGKSLDDITREEVSQIPVGRYGDPAEFGAAAAFLASEQASYLTGQIVTVDGGKLRCTF